MVNKKKKKKDYDYYGIISLVVGIASVFIYYVNILIPISAIIFGLISLKERKNKLAIIGLVLGCLFTFQYININYLIPYLKKEKFDTKNNKIEYSRNSILNKAKKYGFVCGDYICFIKDHIPKDALSESNVEINLDGEYIEETFDLYMDDGDQARVQTRYGYNDGFLISVFATTKSGMFIDYRYNTKTRERSCNYQNMEKCMFNITVSNNLIEYFNNIFNNKS